MEWAGRRGSLYGEAEFEPNGVQQAAGPLRVEGGGGAARSQERGGGSVCSQGAGRWLKLPGWEAGSGGGRGACMVRWSPAGCDFRCLPSKSFPEIPPPSACISLEESDFNSPLSIFKSERSRKW